MPRRSVVGGPATPDSGGICIALEVSMGFAVDGPRSPRSAHRRPLPVPGRHPVPDLLPVLLLDLRARVAQTFLSPRSRLTDG